MAGMFTTAPDLAGGYALVGTNAANGWRTEIRSVLRLRSEEGQSRTAYLTHECRGEAVDPTLIFDGRLYEFAVVGSWLGNFNLRHGSYNFGPGSGNPPSICEKSALELDVHCPEVPVKIHSLADILACCRSQSAGRYFMKIDYQFGEQSWTVYTPARYINFPTGGEADKDYLQPISGYTLFFNRDRFVVTYVAAHLRAKSARIEFIAREPLGLLNSKPGSGRLSTYLRPVAGIVNRLFRIDEFWKVYAVPGQVTFYSYA